MSLSLRCRPPRLIRVALLLATIAFASAAQAQGQALLGVYYGTILCVSNSAFTIKTAALAWFLFGVMFQLPAIRYGVEVLKGPHGGPHPSRHAQLPLRKGAS